MESKARLGRCFLFCTTVFFFTIRLTHVIVQHRRETRCIQCRRKGCLSLGLSDSGVVSSYSCTSASGVTLEGHARTKERKHVLAGSGILGMTAARRGAAHLHCPSHAGPGPTRAPTNKDGHSVVLVGVRAYCRHHPSITPKSHVQVNNKLPPLSCVFAPLQQDLWSHAMIHKDNSVSLALSHLQ